ncbi:MAG: DoxX family membrane protein [Minisyncoccia bacterium]
MSEKGKSYAPVVLRLGTALVFLWFGVSQLLDASNWTGWLPEYAANLPLNDETLVYLNGAFEVFFGLLLLLGLGTRLAAVLLSIHMALIISVVGYSEIGVRDFGIFVAAVAVALNGADKWSLDQSVRPKNDLETP